MSEPTPTYMDWIEDVVWKGDLPPAVELTRHWRKLGVYTLRPWTFLTGIEYPYLVQFKADDDGTVWARWKPDEVSP